MRKELPMNRKKVALSVLAATIFVASTYAQERTAVNSRVRLRSVGPKALPANLPAGGDVFAITVGAFEFAPEGSTLPYVANSVAGGEYLMVGSGPGQTNVLSNINLPTGAVIQ